MSNGSGDISHNGVDVESIPQPVWEASTGKWLAILVMQQRLGEASWHAIAHREKDPFASSRYSSYHYSETQYLAKQRANATSYEAARREIMYHPMFMS